MSTEERTATYIESLYGGNSPVLEEIEKDALEDGVPIIRKSTQNLMKYLLASHSPKDVLEIGAAVCFSSIFMTEYGPEDIFVTTIENYEPRIIKAHENIKKAHKEDKIHLIEGDAIEALEDLLSKEKSYDMIFVDAAKGQYSNYYPYVKKMLRSGGVLICDNVLFDGDIIQSRFAVRRRDRTIHSRMREYLRMLCDDEDFVTTVLPVGDGMTVSLRK